ncbi:MAG: L-threonine 3-dehydrogenase [Thermoguttaceae bacterium]
MKSLVKKFRERGLWMEDVPRPEISPTDALIKIRKTAICGTDLHIYLWDEWSQATIPTPMTIGHEFVGEIVELGAATTGLRVGQRVSGEGHVVCGHCRNCRAGTRHLCINTRGIGVNLPGCFAEYLRIPAENVFPIPDGISDDEAAILDPLGNATHTALSFNLVGEDVLITGAGPIGILAAAICQHVGARNIVITDPKDYRLELAQKLGAKHAINVVNQNLRDVMQEIKMTEGFDIGLEMSGNAAALGDMIATCKAGAKIALLGILPSDATIDWHQVIFKGLFIKGIYGREMFETWYKMCAMIQSGLDVKPIITHHFNVDQFEEAFEIMRSGMSGKIILEW